MSQDPQNVEALIREVYPQLRETARRLLRGEREDHTLQPTALVHETFLRLFGKIPSGAMAPQGFLKLAAHQMRQVLIDYARRHNSLKRGSGTGLVPLGESHPSLPVNLDSLTDLNDALERLGEADPRALSVVELKFFAGFTNDQTAQILGVSDATVEAAWHHARLWLFRELNRPRPERKAALLLSENRSPA